MMFLLNLFNRAVNEDIRTPNEWGCGCLSC